MSHLFYLLFAPFSETLIRIFVYFFGLFFPAHQFEIDRRMRGSVFGLFHGLNGIAIDRYVLFEGVRITLASKVKIYRGVQIVTGAKGSFTIGTGSHIARNSVVSASGGVLIGKNCSISSGVRIYSVTNQADGTVSKAQVRIGDNVLVGSGAYIGPGVSIGDGAAIGSGAVVIKDVAEGVVVVGVPARPV